MSDYEAAMNASADECARIVMENIKRATVGMPPSGLTTRELMLEGARLAFEELEAEEAKNAGTAAVRGQQSAETSSRRKRRARPREEGGMSS